MWRTVTSVAPLFLYNISYVSEEDTVSVGGLIHVDPFTGYCCIPKPLILFKDNVEQAIAKAKEELPGKGVMYLFAIVGAISLYQVAKSFVGSFKKKKLT